MSVAANSATISARSPIRTRYWPNPAMRETAIDWIGTVPEHWDVAPLYARYWLELGKMLDAKRITGDHLTPYLRNVDVKWDHINADNLPEMDIELHEEGRFVLRRGDLLVCEGGEVGRAAIWQDELPRCGYQKALHRLRPRSSRDFTRFLYYSLSHAASTGVFVAQGNPNTIPHLTGEQLRVYRFPFPPKDEQRAIVAFLDRETARIDALIAKKQRLIELLQEKRTALVARAVRRGVKPCVSFMDSGIDWLGQVPSHWALKRLGYLVSIRGGCTPDKGNAEYWNGDVPWVTPKDMKVETIADSEDHVTSLALRETGLTLLTQPAVLIVVRGMILAHTIPIARLAGPVTVNQDMKALTPKRNIDARFLAWMLRGCDSAFFALVEESGHGTRVLRTDLWMKATFPLPPLPEQIGIAAFLDNETAKLDELQGRITVAIDRLREYRSALISAAVTGKIDVRDATPKESVCASV